MKTAITLQGNQSHALRLGIVAKRVVNLIDRVATPVAAALCIAVLGCAVTDHEAAAAILGLVCLFFAMRSLDSEKGGAL